MWWPWRCSLCPWGHQLLEFTLRLHPGHASHGPCLASTWAAGCSSRHVLGRLAAPQQSCWTSPQLHSGPGSCHPTRLPSFLQVRPASWCDVPADSFLPSPTAISSLFPVKSVHISSRLTPSWGLLLPKLDQPSEMVKAIPKIKVASAILMPSFYKSLICGL